MSTSIESNNIFQETNIDENSTQLQEWQLEEIEKALSETNYVPEKEMELFLESLVK